MKNLSFAARAYIWAVLALGGVVLLWSLPALTVNESQWLVFAALAAGAAAAQLFPVVNPKNQAYYVTLVFLFGGVLLLPPGALALLVVVAFVPEWIKGKYRWYIQSFNIASFLIDTFLARAVYVWTGGNPGGALNHPNSIAAAVLAAAFFTVINHISLAIVLRLARGRSWRETHLFEIENFLIDATLSCMGIITALLWQVNPWLVALSAAPLFLIYRALNNPNLKEQARTDPKTGLYNATHFYEVLREELKRSMRFERPVSIVMADLDLLRNINNTYGHLAGDVVLKGVADILKAGLRDYDVAARFGGEEFIILLPETDPAQALATAERLRQQVEETRFAVSTSVRPIQATLSLGVASFPADGENPNEIIHQADLAVYYAKLRGRNLVWASSPESVALGKMMADLPNREEYRGTIVSDSPHFYRPDVTVSPEVSRSEPEISTQPATSPRLEEEVRFEDPDEQTIVKPPAPPNGNRGRSRLRRWERAHDASWEIVLLVAAVVVGAATLYAVHQPWHGNLNWLGLGVLAGMIIATQVYSIDIYGQGKTSTSAILVLAGSILFGVDGALLLAPLVALTQWVVSRGPKHRSLFDFGNLTISASASAFVYGELAGGLPGAEPAWLLLPAGLAALAYYVVNHALVSLAMGLSEKCSPLHVWQERFRWLLLYYPVYGALALAIALAYRSIGIYGMFAFVAPLLMMRYTMKQYIVRTEENVAKLKLANQDLVHAHEEVVSTLARLRTTYDATILALSAALDSRDSETEGHSRRVVDCVALIASKLGLSEREMPDLLNGAILHDVGKIGAPDAILRKPGPLTADEWAVMKTHPEQGYQMLKHIDFLKGALPVIRHHHERYDGSGYPNGLIAAEIPLGARIFAVADAFDAMTSHRPYRQACSYEVAREEIIRCNGSQFDPYVVAAFLQIDVSELADNREQHSTSREHSQEEGQMIYGRQGVDAA
ncbi:MAG: diguanylate cyclase [Chloroflexi bacterium]|nr:diguanylate cyclase [Chloroflexota bacterium]